MTDEQGAILDDLLSRWHAWQQAQRSTRGYADRALVCGNYKISRQYDDSNGALDADLESMRSRQVDHEVREMQDPHRSAIYALARSLWSGRAVWHSPRMPEDPAARARIVAEARATLAKRLVASGVI